MYECVYGDYIYMCVQISTQDWFTCFFVHLFVEEIFLA